MDSFDMEWSRPALAPGARVIGRGDEVEVAAAAIPSGRNSTEPVRSDRVTLAASSRPTEKQAVS